MKIPSRLTTNRRVANESFLRHEGREWREGVGSPRSDSNRPLIICYRPFHRALCHPLPLWFLQALFECSCEIDHLSVGGSFFRGPHFFALRFPVSTCSFLPVLGVPVPT